MSNREAEPLVPQQLLTRLFQRKVVPFLGAGCSVPAPSRLPTASELARVLVEQGAGHDGQALEDIAEDAWAAGDWPAFAQLLPINEWRTRPPNLVTRVVVELCRETVIGQILTTNWDLLIESALQQIGQPYSKIVDAQSLAIEPAGTVTLIKLNGCIEHPRFIKATRTQIEAEDWLDAWIDAVFEVLVRTNSLLFAGYSGASRAATATIAAIVSAAERQANDFIVDREPPEAISASSESGRKFIQATTLVPFTGDACDFFAALRESVFRLLLPSEAGPGPSRARRYPAAAIDALTADRERRSDRRLAAHGALHWGLPVVDSALTLVDDGRLYFRGNDAIGLSRTAGFETVCWDLWQDPGPCPDLDTSPVAGDRGPANPIPRLANHLTRQAELSVLSMGSLAARDAGPALRVVAGLFAALGATGGGSLARRLADGWGVLDRVDDINGALVLCADHELNISAFTARCVASADARLEYVLLAALCAFSGGRHGGATERVTALFRDVRSVGPVRAVDRALTEGALPGFGHPLYPDGDPRGAELLDRARRIGGIAPEVDELIDVVGRQLGLRPTVDAGLVVLAESAGLPPDAAPAMFALGRSAGWIAHALEAARDDQLIRPRARYVGPPPH